MERADVQSSLTQGRSNTADETGRIFVNDIQHVAFKLGFKADAENLDKPCFAIGKQSARDGAWALGGVDGYAHQCVISAGLVMAHFANVKATLFCQKWRVDHVHCIRKTTHKAR